MLARNGSPLTVCPEEDLASATPDPEPSQPPPSCAELPEPTADGEPEPAAVEPSPSGAIERTTAPEPEPETSDQSRRSPSVAWARRGSAHLQSVGVESGGSLISTSSLRSSDSASALRPCGYTMAPSSLISTVARRSTGLPRPYGSAPVSRHPAVASGLHSSGCASSLRPSGSAGLLLPSSSASVLDRSGSTAALRISASASVAGAICSALALRILGVAPDLRLSVSASGSTTTCSAAVGRPPGVVSPSSTMAPPSVGSTVGRHLGCGLGLTWLLLLQLPPVFSLAPPSG
ncbi:hypothetical protein QQF64_010438 [Cirrhinus molitorella]|uniref:Uncharacterized protein n=1 Tax=Cirrhinus molitorella TaxID=172907 RepID=A0ABR3M6E9_9TELE